MNLTEKIAYIRGLCEGLNLDESKPEVKVMNAIIDHDDDEDDEENEDDVFYEVTCDACGQKLNVSEDVLLEGEIECPNCGELLEFDFSDIFDGEECDPADCEGCSSNCNSSEE